MDSKLFYKVLALVLGIMTIMFALVLFVNYRSGRLAAEEKTVSSNPVAAESNPNVTKTEYGTLIGNDLDAFENDVSFFNQDITNTQLEGLENNFLTLIVTSIQRDLRIQIVDVMGNLVSGESFYVTLEGVGEYKDLDKDGVIYIGDLKPGEYEVSLNELEGYVVSSTALKVNVKSQVSYTEISDISLLIKTEDDIDVSLEDTAVKEAVEDSDESEIVEAITTADGRTRLGIDVSKWNGEIDWSRVKAAGVEFAVIRCGYRGSKTGALVEDPYFVKNIEGAKEAGISVGVYFFTQATNEVEAVEEASMVLCLCEQYDLEYPIYIDTEGAGGKGRADGLDKDTRTLAVSAFCSTIMNSGKHVGVYASRNWFLNQLDMSKLEDYYIWLAEYRSEPLYMGDYQLWQYTSHGTIDGIEGRVDLDYSYLGY